MLFRNVFVIDSVIHFIVGRENKRKEQRTKEKNKGHAARNKLGNTDKETKAKNRKRKEAK